MVTTTGKLGASRRLWLIDLFVLIAYVAVVSAAVIHHEPWGDEAQAWLMARDMPLGKMLFSEMHYEVSPGLWHGILWVAQHVFHAGYGALSWIGAACGVAGAAVLIFCSPFPRPLRYLMASSYYVIYQYAVIARPYVLVLLCGELAVEFYRRRRPVPLAISLSLLAATSIHGMILAGAIGAGAVWRASSHRREITAAERKDNWFALFFFLVVFAFLCVIAFPAPDLNAFANAGHTDYAKKTVETLADAVAEPWYVGAAVLLLIGAFTWVRREFIVFLLGVGGLLFFHIRVYGAVHHAGLILLGVIFSLWIAWPEPGETAQKWLVPAAAVLLCVVFGLQTLWAASALRHDYSEPYSGSKDAAAFLRSIGAERARIYGFFFPDVALNAYFERNIYANWPTSYVHQSLSGSAAIAQMTAGEPPKYVVVSLEPDDIPLLRQWGYVPIHVSPGLVFFKNRVAWAEPFVVYERRFQ